MKNFIYFTFICITLILIIFNSSSLNSSEVAFGYGSSLLLSCPFYIKFSKFKTFKFVKKISNLFSFFYELKLKKTIEKDSFFLICCVISFIFLNSCSKFYTGNNFLEALSNLFSGENNYLYYQTYFDESVKELNPFEKSYYILQNSISRVIVLLFIPILTLRFTSSHYPLSKLKTLLYFIFLLMPVALFSVARGTNIEVFDSILSVFFAFAYFDKKYFLYFDLINFKKILSKPFKILLLAAPIFLALFIFYQRISERLSLTDSELSICLHSDFCYQPNPLTTNMPAFSNLIFFLSGYFLHGSYVMAKFVEWTFSDPLNIVASLIPFGQSSIMQYDPGGYVCRNLATCGSQWKSAYILLIPWIGLLAWLFFSWISASLYDYLCKLKSPLSCALAWNILSFYLFIPYNFDFIFSSSFLIPFVMLLCFPLLNIILIKNHKFLS